MIIIIDCIQFILLPQIRLLINFPGLFLHHVQEFWEVDGTLEAENVILYRQYFVYHSRPRQPPAQD